MKTENSLSGNKKRCPWPGNDLLYIDYHDNEWGRPEHDDAKLFEKLILDGAQAGLSWITILCKREGYRRAFDNFDIDKILKYDDKKEEQLMQNPEIVRNRLKIKSVKTNAVAFREIQCEFGTFNAYLWGFVDGKTVQNNWTDISQIPTSTELSDRISRDLKKRGFKFVGTTIIYAYLQAIGVINDHLVGCFAHKEVNKPHI